MKSASCSPLHARVLGLIFQLPHRYLGYGQPLHECKVLSSCNGNRSESYASWSHKAKSKRRTSDGKVRRGDNKKDFRGCSEYGKGDSLKRR